MLLEQHPGVSHSDRLEGTVTMQRANSSGATRARTTTPKSIVKRDPVLPFISSIEARSAKQAAKLEGGVQ